jgi:hypothetical protein
MAGGHDSHGHDEHGGAAHPHPPLPTITDEAADTPMWVPMAGLAIFLVLALFVALRSALSPPDEAPGQAASEEAATGETGVAAGTPSGQ